MRRNVLLLQGPVGPFFRRLSLDLESRGFNVYKVHFNGGDSLFYHRKNTINYTGKLKHWGAYLERLLKNNDIGRIYLFGDCRSYHKVAREIAERLSVRVFVFEEGYIRPDYVTLEEGGVNGHSPMLRGPLDYSNTESHQSQQTLRPANVFIRTALYSMGYYLSAAFQRRRFPYYQHHRSFNPLSEGLPWIVSAFRKWRYAHREKDFLTELLPQFESNYFVCPLQVHCDMQVTVHSEYNSIEHFIGEVVASFAEHAATNKALVFKHHPMDRGYTDYSLLFDNLASKYGLQGRLFYVHDICLPTLLQSAQGTVLINSTVGVSSLFHGTPVKTMGRAIYDQPGLTYEYDLDTFWKRPGSVDKALFNRFRNYLVTHNQLNGSLYRPLAKSGDYAGLIWSNQLLDQHRYIESREESGRPQLRVVGGRMATVPNSGMLDSGSQDAA